RNALYCGLAPNERAELHRRVAIQLERAYPSERLPLYEIAQHYFLAAAVGCRAQALEYSRRAAAQAADARDFELAAGLYDRALLFADSQGLDPARHHELLCATGDAWYQAGRLEQATARYERAAALARAEQHWERFASAVLLAAHALRSSLLHGGPRSQQLR